MVVPIPSTGKMVFTPYWSRVRYLFYFDEFADGVKRNYCIVSISFHSEAYLPVERCLEDDTQGLM